MSQPAIFTPTCCRAENIIPQPSSLSLRLHPRVEVLTHLMLSEGLWDLVSTKVWAQVSEPCGCSWAQSLCGTVALTSKPFLLLLPLAYYLLPLEPPSWGITKALGLGPLLTQGPSAQLELPPLPASHL